MLRPGQLSVSGKQFLFLGNESQHLMTLLFKWRCIDYFNKFCSCELVTMIDLALLATMTGQDFCGGYPAVRSSNGKWKIMSQQLRYHTISRRYARAMVEIWKGVE